MNESPSYEKPGTESPDSVNLHHRNPGPVGETHPVIGFQLNERWIETRRHPARLVLDFIRRDGRLTGTKEGCKEGDCGACVVLLAEPAPEDGAPDRLRFRPVTSCLLPLADVHGKWVLTVEGIDLGAPSPVQSRLVDAGASQCGFCTPGIVMSLTAMALDGRRPTGPCHVATGQAADEARVDRALSGHLCRCTGYRSLRQAGMEILDSLPSGEDPEETESWEALVQAGWLPSEWQETATSFLSRARQLEADAAGQESPGSGEGVAPAGPVLGGGTDLYVQRGDALERGPVLSLAGRPDLGQIQRRDDVLEIGARVTFEDLSASDEMLRLVPGMVEHMHWIASLQVRHRATVAGNLVNASPIGDVTVLMLALDARLRLDGPDGERVVALRDFYQGYKVMDLRPGEIVTHVLLDAALDEEPARCDFQKVSKRKCLDIASVNAAACLRERGGVIAHAAFAVGGVAPIPFYARDASTWAVGRPLSADTVAGIRRRVLQAVAPIDDVRGSAEYKRRLTGRLVTAHFLTWFPELLSPDAVTASVVGGGR